MLLLYSADSYCDLSEEEDNNEEVKPLELPNVRQVIFQYVKYSILSFIWKTIVDIQCYNIITKKILYFYR